MLYVDGHHSITNSALSILCHNEVTLKNVMTAFPEELSFMEGDKALCHRLQVEGIAICCLPLVAHFKR